MGKKNLKKRKEKEREEEKNSPCCLLSIDFSRRNSNSEDFFNNAAKKAVILHLRILISFASRLVTCPLLDGKEIDDESFWSSKNKYIFIVDQ